MKFISIALILIVFNTFASKSKGNIDESKVGLMIIDAQKWYIPGHPESIYNKWNIKGHKRTSDSIISSMKTVLDWANLHKLQIFVTFEAKDSGPYNLPDEILSRLDSTRTTRFVKKYYDATKHQEFKKLVINSNIQHWIIIGAETDVCVYQTSKGLIKMGKKVTLVKDAIYSGRNNTNVSEKNLRRFGVNIIDKISNFDINSLEYKMTNTVESPIEFNEVILTIFPFDNSMNLNNGVIKRLESLRTYAKITRMKTEIPDSLSKNKAVIRVLAGNVNDLNYTTIKNTNPKDIIILEDVIASTKPTLLIENLRSHTVKSFFYELMETVDFYFTDPELLPEWQKSLRISIDNDFAPYLESFQND